MTEKETLPEEPTSRPWRVRVDDSFPNRTRLVIEGDHLSDNPLSSYVVCAEDMEVRRERAVEDYALIVKAVNAHDALVDAARDALEDVTGPITHSGIKIRHSTRDKLIAALKAAEQPVTK